MDGTGAATPSTGPGGLKSGAPTSADRARRSLLKRFARHALPFLLFGVLATVGVAWAIVIFVRPKPGAGPDIDPPAKWPGAVPDGWPSPNGAYRWPGWGYRFECVYSTYLGRGPNGKQMVLGRALPHVRVGWPLRCLDLSWIEEEDMSTVFTPGLAGLFVNGIPSPIETRHVADRDRLPIRPMAMGFGADAVFYALLAWLPFGAFVGMRTVIRARAGRCLTCGYQLADLAQCPECGRDLARRDSPEPST